MMAGLEPDGAGGLKPCDMGFYKEARGTANCSRCPDGTTTSGFGTDLLSGCRWAGRGVWVEARCERTLLAVLLPWP